MSLSRKFIGWRMIGVGAFCYGFGIAPMYYCWGFFLPEMRQEIALTETESGLVFSVFSYTYHLLGPVVGWAMGRWGIRSVVGLGSCLAVVAFLGMSRAESFSDCLLAYGILGGFAIGFSTILPAQNLASNWFVKYRARALATVLAGGAVVGFLVNKYFAPQVVTVSTWRIGWLMIAAISAVVAVVAFLFIRGTPESVGQRPDGLDAARSETEAAAASAGGSWSASRAMRTYQFYVLVALSVAYGVPWGVISVYGRLHLESIGYTTALAGSILGVRVLVSLFGRLCAFFGDFISPQVVLGLVLLVEGLGSAGLVWATTPALAYLSVILVGLGFGAAYVSIPVAYSSFYGRRAFGATVGARFAITGLIAPAAPTVAGLLSDWTGSYATALLSMAGICIVGGLTAFWLPHPGRPGSELAPAAAS